MFFLEIEENRERAKIKNDIEMDLQAIREGVKSSR